MTDQLQFYGFWRSLAAFRVRVAMALKGISFSEETVDLLAGEQHSADFKKMNPQARLPVLIVEDQVLTQSLAIIEYLEETHPEPSLLPSDPILRAKARAFALINIADTHPLVIPAARKQLATQFGADEDAIKEWAIYFHELGLGQMEGFLDDHRANGWKFAFGDKPSIADLALASHVAGSNFFGASLDAAPTVAKIFGNCMELEAFSANSPMALKAAAEG